jgi:hypothetical protein
MSAFSRTEIHEVPHEDAEPYSDGFRGIRTMLYYDWSGQLVLQKAIYPKGYICNVCKTPYAEDQTSCQKCHAQGPYYD